VSPQQDHRQAVREQLERLLSSACFSRSERSSRLLRFLVEKRLEDRESELKESIIGIEVFGRKTDYNPKVDSTVRSEVARLRTRLSRYYATEGRRDQLLIELPKVGYVPFFRLSEVIPPLPDPAAGRYWLGGAAVLAAFVMAIGAWWILHRNAPIRIAVVPLVNMSQDGANEYLADGMTSEIINDLSIIEGLSVRSQTSSFALKGKPRTVREVGAQLDADYVLEGSVLRVGQQLRINTQLVRVRDDVPVWSARFEPELTAVLSVQDEISRGIVNSLRLKLGRGRRRYEISAEAYDLYLQARASATQLFPGDPEVISRFEKVTVKDASFAPAYAGLAAAHAWRSSVGVAAPEQADQLDRMRAAADRAIQLDPLLAEAHSAMGAVYARNGEWNRAEQSFRRAIEIAPSLSSAHALLARFVLWPLGRMAEALREMRLSERNDPLSPRAHWELADLLLSAGRYDEAANQCHQIPADALYNRECLGRTRLAQGRTDEAIRILAASPVNNWGYLANAYARAGRRAEAEKLMTEAPALYPDRRGAFQFALAYAGFGDKDRTLERLERLSRVGPVRIGYTLISPEFAFLRDDPRSKALRKKMGLPE
jgi:TolB-like protein